MDAMMLGSPGDSELAAKLLEAFAPAGLRFVRGHELAH